MSDEQRSSCRSPRSSRSRSTGSPASVQRARGGPRQGRRQLGDGHGINFNWRISVDSGIPQAAMDVWRAQATRARTRAARPDTAHLFSHHLPPRNVPGPSGPAFFFLRPDPRAGRDGLEAEGAHLSDLRSARGPPRRPIGLRSRFTFSQERHAGGVLRGAGARGGPRVPGGVASVVTLAGTRSFGMR